MNQDENGLLGYTVAFGMVHGHKEIPEWTRGRQLSLYKEAQRPDKVGH